MWRLPTLSLRLAGHVSPDPSRDCYTARVNEQQAPTEVDEPQPQAEPAAEGAPTESAMLEPESPTDPDTWLQWGLIIGVLALLLICAAFILIAWIDR